MKDYLFESIHINTLEPDSILLNNSIEIQNESMAMFLHDKLYIFKLTDLKVSNSVVHSKGCVFSTSTKSNFLTLN